MAHPRRTVPAIARQLRIACAVVCLGLFLAACESSAAEKEEQKVDREHDQNIGAVCADRSDRAAWARLKDDNPQMSWEEIKDEVNQHCP